MPTLYRNIVKAVGYGIWGEGYGNCNVVVVKIDFSVLNVYKREAY